MIQQVNCFQARMSEISGLVYKLLCSILLSQILNLVTCSILGMANHELMGKLYFIQALDYLRHFTMD